VGGAMVDIGGVTEWLIGQALSNPTYDELFSGCCERLLATGIPLLRANVSCRALHPLVSGRFFNWWRDRAVEIGASPHRDRPADGWRQSPLYHMMETRQTAMRRRLVGPEAQLDFPLLVELRDAGATDYFGYAMGFGGEDKTHAQDGIVGSWATDRPEGFTEAEVATLTRLKRPLAAAFRVQLECEKTRNILNAYVGPELGREVLAGIIRRGDGQMLRAAFWYSDLRNSTALAASLPLPRFLARLNDYFECAGGAVCGAGGEVLGLVGDAVLGAIAVDIGGVTEAAACAGLLKAAEAALAGMAAYNARLTPGEEPMEFGIGLHLGTAIFGNIGMPDRLAFTAIGAAINEVSRVEGLTKALGQPVLATHAFAEASGASHRSLGHHELRGVVGAQEIFSPTLLVPA
jgi:adenylate cyclase